MAAPSHITDEQVEGLGQKIEDEVNSAVVRPGDTLIIGISRNITREEADNFIAFCQVKLPDVKILILPEIVELRVFRPSEPEGM